MASRIYYNTEVEEARKVLYKKALKTAPPVALLKFNGGAVAVAVSNSQFRKIRSVHDQFLFVAAGEHQATNSVFAMLVSQGISVEQNFSKRELSLSFFLNHPGSVVEQNGHIFQSVDTRPRMVMFALYSLADVPWCGAVIDPTGARVEFERFCAIGLHEDPLTEKKSADLSLRPDLPERDAIDALKNAIRSKYKEPFDRFEVGVLRAGGNEMIFEHRWEECP